MDEIKNSEAPARRLVWRDFGAIWPPMYWRPIAFD